MKALRYAQRFVDIVRSSGLRVAAGMAWRKAMALRRASMPRRYLRWLADPRQGARVHAHGCRVSVVLPVHDTPAHHLEACIRSVLGQRYRNWELCICDDASTRADTREVLERHRGTDPRIRMVRSDENLHISRATNLAAEQASGRFLAFLDHDDLLHPMALFEVARADLVQGDIDLLYTDEDELDEAGHHLESRLKPDWSPEHLDSTMYLGHLLVIRKRLYWRLGGLRHEFTGAQDYDLALRASATARRVHHVDKVLYHGRATPAPKATDAARHALQDALHARGAAASVEDGLAPGTFRVRHALRESVPVTLLIFTDHRKRIIPGRGEVDLLRNFIHSIREDSTYRNYRILVVDNGNATEQTRSWLYENGVRRESHAPSAPFNFARKANHALTFVDTEQVILLNDDLEVISPDWIECLLEHSQRPDIGAVGAQLQYQDDTIQHAGVVLGVNESTAHVFHGRPASRVGYCGFSHIVRNYSAVTGAVLATRMSVIKKAGGFDEALAIDFNDIDLCLRIRDLGLRIVYTPYCRLYHFEGSTQVRAVQDPFEVEHFHRRWADVIARDPYYNVNLSRTGTDFEPLQGTRVR